ncbi:MAG: hypothetical protein JKY66_07255 [Spongiibacteraceae bacterium]|nr:hypothetical protein [Spongiibacteraceae bacterium]
MSAILSTPSSIADTIIIPVARQGQDLAHIERPQKGNKQHQVIKKFGDPLHTSGPKGEPPIERWDYANFSVYFENGHVIHSVLKHTNPEK